MYDPHADTRLLVHVIWTTRHRAPLLPPSLDAHLKGLLVDALPARCAALLAFGASGDHVHVLLQLAATGRLCDAVKAMKGASARRWNQQLFGGSATLYWQGGYWARSANADDVEALTAYILDQRAHHATQQRPEPWEITAKLTKG